MNNETYGDPTEKKSIVDEILKEESQNYLKNNGISEKYLNLNDILKIVKTAYNHIKDHKNTESKKILQYMITGLTNYQKLIDKDNLTKLMAKIYEKKILESAKEKYNIEKNIGLCKRDIQIILGNNIEKLTDNMERIKKYPEYNEYIEIFNCVPEEDIDKYIDNMTKADLDKIFPNFDISNFLKD